MLLDINEVVWPPHSLASWREKHPNAPPSAEDEVSEGLKEWFIIVKSAHPRMLGMTSVSIDDLWHEIILDTRFYADFCNRYIGFFVHHTTNKANPQSDSAMQQELSNSMRTWMAACYLIQANPYQPSQLPRLFRLDRHFSTLRGHYFKLPSELEPATASYICPSDWLKLKSP
jgi:hypothetical protein